VLAGLLSLGITLTPAGEIEAIEGTLTGPAGEANIARILGAIAKAKKACPPPNPSELSVLNKLERYLLNPDHAEGGPKADWF